MRIVEIPENVKPFFICWRELVYNGKEYTYAIVKKEFGTLQGVPEVFAYYIGDFYCLSDVYPEKWIEIGILHEFLEVESGVVDTDELVCLRMTQKELEIAKSRGYEMKEYISFRIKFFKDLANFHSQFKNFTFKKLEHSLSYLNSLQ
jgi:hypothetical protein